MPPKPSAKIPLSEIAKLEHLMDQEPARAPSEVSKRQAVAMLAPKLHEMRRKGYPWRDVAAWLSGHGLTLSAAALQRHLRGIKHARLRDATRGRGKASGNGKAAAPPALAASAAATAEVPKVSPSPGPSPVEPRQRDLEASKGPGGFTVRPDRRIP
jgi:hypothetical protein